MRLPQASLPSFNDAADSECWPAYWVAVPETSGPSFVVAYRLEIDLPEAVDVRVHVTADQRYRFFVDGELEGEGPDRGDLHSWSYQSYSLALSRGRHTLVALVASLDRAPGIMPGAQITMFHGFLLAADAPHTETFSTGVAKWEAAQVQGLTFKKSGLEGAGLESGAVVVIDGSKYTWGVESGKGDVTWKPVVSVQRAFTRLSSRTWGLLLSPLLTPGTLPPQVGDEHTFTNVRYFGQLKLHDGLLQATEEDRLQEEEQSLRNAWQKGEATRIGPNSERWFIVDLDDYYCGYPEVTVEKGAGAIIDMVWAESLYEGPGNHNDKRNRNDVLGKYFKGRGDSIHVGTCDAPRRFTTFWWSCGRYVAFKIKTAAEELVIRPFRLRESRYPMQKRATIELANANFSRSQKIMWRTLQMCAHETYMDCPYYEQLNYAADTRVQSLVTYICTGDDVLAKRCIELFGNSNTASGLTLARYPCSIPQVIPQFSLFWVSMLYDLGLWRGEKEKSFITRYLPRTRLILEEFLGRIGDDGVLQIPAGWDWVDWVNSPKGSLENRLAANHLQLIYILRLAVALERWAGRETQADYYEAERQRLWKTAVATFWSEERGLFADLASMDSFSQQCQCYAVLGGLMNDAQMERVKAALPASDDLVPSSYYFKFYLFETYAALGLHHKIVEDFGEWGEMVDNGLRTTLESKGHSRSDCHAWSSNPLYHAVASIAGIRPAGLGSRNVEIRPAFHAVPAAQISVPLPAGAVDVEWNQEGKLRVSIPAGVNAVLNLSEGAVNLASGLHELQINAAALQQS